MKKIVSLLIIVLLLTACGEQRYQVIDTNEAISIINNGAVLIDVRTTEEYNREHIPSAVNIPLDQINTVAYPKDTTIIVYCQAGTRSRQAVETLANMGYTTLYELDGGLLNWGGELEE